MKQSLHALLAQTVARLTDAGRLPANAAAQIHIEPTRDPAHGDFACNLALRLAKSAGVAPLELAQVLRAALPQADYLEKTEVAPPGFINFFIAPNAWRAGLVHLLESGANFGRSDSQKGRRALVEFVSANPTGPLHVGHGRGAAYGDAVARLLDAVGYAVDKEYYVNDAGRQMDILALSVWLRYLECCGVEVAATRFPPNAYRGDYVRDLAVDLKQQHGAALGEDTENLFAELPTDPEARLDALIAQCKTRLGASYETVFRHGCATLVAEIGADLAEFGVEFDRWFSENSLLQNGDIERALAALDKNGHIYQKHGATWFRASNFGDEKDRAVRRADGSHTYFASDIAYHYHKAERGYDLLLNVFGADHHGYAKRIAASFQAFGYAPSRLQFRLVQFAVLYRGDTKIQMSTRAGEFVTLRQLRDEVGVDAARFFYVSRKNDQHLDFDLALAKTQSADNPVYYIQYAHARICSVFRQLKEKNLPDLDAVTPNYALLALPAELALCKNLLRFPEVVEQAATQFEPHQLSYYLRDLATEFHAYYNAHPFLGSEEGLRNARLGLIAAVAQVIVNGLGLLGVSAPEKM